jgi:hypothetical protein
MPPAGGDAEVGELGNGAAALVPERRDEDVRRLYVVVDNTLAVNV